MQFLVPQVLCRMRTEDGGDSGRISPTGETTKESEANWLARRGPSGKRPPAGALIPSVLNFTIQCQTFTQTI